MKVLGFGLIALGMILLIVSSVMLSRELQDTQITLQASESYIEYLERELEACDKKCQAWSETFYMDTE